MKKSGEVIALRQSLVMIFPVNTLANTGQYLPCLLYTSGTCQLAVLSGAADELDVKESTVELSNNSVENGEVENVEVSSETASQQVAEKVESISETKENSLPQSSQTLSLIHISTVSRFLT